MSSQQRILEKRISQFPDNGLQIKKDKLYCEICKQDIAHDTKSHVKQHIETTKHTTKQDSPQEDDEPEDLNKQWSEMVYSFVAAGIPLNVFENTQFRNWMKKYTKNGDFLPSTSTLRRRVESVASKDLEKTISWCHGHDIALIMDESTDPLNRKVLNVLVYPLIPNVKPRLVSTSFLESCDAKSIMEACFSVVKMLNQDLDNFVTLISDNAPYMVSAGEKLKEFCPRILHTTCWSHVLHLTAEEIRGQMDQTDKFIATVKKSLIKAPARRAEYYEACKQEKKAEKLPPVPVITRWATWLEAGSFNFQYLDVLVTWIENNKEITGSMKTLKFLIQKNGDEIAQELERINKVYPGLSSTLKILEGNYIIASDVWNHLQLLNSYIKHLGLSNAKLDLYLLRKHPALRFWFDVQQLDPKRCSVKIVEGLPESLLRFSKEKISNDELLKYRQLSLAEINNNSQRNPIEFWDKYSSEMPCLSSLALKALSVRPSSAEVERSFSYLTKLLSPQRLSLTEKNLDGHLRITFNSKQKDIISEENY